LPVVDTFDVEIKSHTYISENCEKIVQKRYLINFKQIKSKIKIPEKCDKLNKFKPHLVIIVFYGHGSRLIRAATGTAFTSPFNYFAAFFMLRCCDLRLLWLWLHYLFFDLY
jgi:hypothetical protein